MPAKPSLGLYFTDNFIEVSQVSAEGNRLERFNQMILPVGLVVNGEIKNNLALVQVLRELFAGAKPRPIKLNEEVVIGISDNRVFLREFKVPNVQGKNINDVIEYQVRSLSPVMPAGVETDWQIIGKDLDDQIEVLLAAIPRNIIESWVAICTMVGLRVVAVEPAVFANIRIINQGQLQGRNQILLYLGDNFSIFSYITSGNPRFSDFLPQSEIEKKGGLNKTVLAYINFINAKYSNRLIQEVVVAGSRPEIESVVEGLKTEKIPAIKGLSRLTKTAVTGLELLQTSNGLSLKTFDQHPLNILPLDFRLEVIRERLTRSWKLVLNALIVLTILGGLGLFYLYRGILDKETRLTALRNQYKQELDLPKSQDLVAQTAKLNKVTSQIVTLRATTGGEESILKELSAITPNGIVLTSLVFSRDPQSKKLTDPSSSWIITGTANSRPLVLNFYNSLISNPDFAGGKLYFGSLEKDTGLTFRIASQTNK